MKGRFLRSAVNRESASFSDELAEGESTCPNCQDCKFGFFQGKFDNFSSTCSAHEW